MEAKIQLNCETNMIIPVTQAGTQHLAQAINLFIFFHTHHVTLALLLLSKNELSLVAL